ncbi:MAG: RNA 3'-terminal phosphate cyclase [Acidobacteriota bacterium]
MIILDGSYGEGGGQILRTALALSLITGKAFRIEKIRARRKNPGLLKQHLTSVSAAATVGDAELNGATLGSQYLTFTPRAIKAGEYTFAIGTAGSAMLVLQTILPALLTTDAPSLITLEGGTHNPFAPPFDFLAKTFLPVVSRMGAKVSARLERYGFYPAGGGKAQFEIHPCTHLARLELTRRSESPIKRARAIVANLPRHIAERELDVVRRKLDLDRDQLFVEETANANGQGNILMIEIESKNITEIFTAFGERGIRAEDVARKAVNETRNYLQSDAAVGEHLADQLLLPMAIGSGGRFTASEISLHTKTNIEVIKQFLNVEIQVVEINKHCWQVEVIN